MASVIFRIKRQARYDKLRKYGFTKFESQEYSKVIFSHAPWLKVMMRERLSELRSFVKQGGNRKDFETTIRQEYADNKWFRVMKVFGVNRRVIDPWKFYRKKRDEWIKLNPEWESPGGRKKSRRPKAPTDRDREAMVRRMGKGIRGASEELRSR